MGQCHPAYKHCSSECFEKPSLFENLVDRRLPLTEANLAIDLMAQKKTMKTVLFPSDGEEKQ